MSTLLSAFIWYSRQSREISVPIWLMSPLQGTRGGGSLTPDQAELNLFGRFQGAMWALRGCDLSACK